MPSSFKCWKYISYSFNLKMYNSTYGNINVIYKLITINAISDG